MAAELNDLDPAWAWSPFEPDARRPWDRKLAAHLYRRAGFAANTRELDEAARLTPAAAVGRLLQPELDNAAEQELEDFGKAILARRNPQALSAWWLYRMLHTQHQLLEKTTLFWHGHFATSAAKVDDARAMLDQNELLRRNALGDFETMVQAISRDPAMLIYLDSTENKKTQPNENYARELMELFCLGLGNYTEKDIQEIARCFTGWEVRRGRFVFNKYQYDKGEKSFLGRRGKFGGEDAVRIVISQQAAPRFIVEKLVRYFVFDEPRPPATLIEPLARELRENEFNIGPTIARILNSQLFFSEHAVGRKVRSPVELGVGMLRALEARTNIFNLSQAVSQLGHAPFFPPSVKGWDGGRTWINSSTLLGRANLVRVLATSGDTKFAEGDLESLASRHGVSQPDELVEWLIGLLVAAPVPNDARLALVDLGRNANGNRSQRIAKVIHAISTLPEFQLS